MPTAPASHIHATTFRHAISLEGAAAVDAPAGAESGKYSESTWCQRFSDLWPREGLEAAFAESPDVVLDTRSCGYQA